MQPDVFCLMPWVHLHVTTRGKVQACCVGNIPYGDINTSSIEEIWQSAPIRNFRLKLLRNEAEPRCRVCYAREAAGATSMRQEVNAAYAHRQNWVDQTDAEGFAPDSSPLYWDIRFSNLCNFRCRTCWHGASSRWFEEGQQLKRTAGPEALIRAAKDPAELMRQLESLLPFVEEIYFAGGEPLMMEEHDQLLSALEELGRFDVLLRYNTNFSRLDYFGRDILKVWSRFDRVVVGASLDASGEQGELLRKGQNWTKTVAHRKRMLEACPNVQFEIHPTVSALNVLHLPDFHREWVEAGLVDLDAIYLNLLERPDFYNVKVLPEDLRVWVRERYAAHGQWLAVRGAAKRTVGRFEEVVAFMDAGDLSRKLGAFKNECARLDAMREEDVLGVFELDL